MTAVLRRLLKVHPAEAAVAGRMLALMSVLWIGAWLGANAIESLLFVRVGPRVLPYLYVALGILTFAAMVGINALLGRLPGERFVVLVPIVLALLVAAMRLAILSPGRWIYPVLWLAMMVIWTVQLLTAWTLAGMVHDTRQAKRLFPLYGSGLIVGGVLGGLATGPLAELLGAENLPLFWVASLLVDAALARDVLRIAGVRGRRRSRPRTRDAAGLLGQLGEGFRVVRASGLLRWMAVTLSLLALLYFSLSLLFAQAATARFPGEEQLAGFLGSFTGVSSGAALLVSLLLANRLFAAFGVPAMVLVLPVLYLIGFGSLVLGTAFGVLVVFRFAQITWVNGVWATGWQALFNVVPSRQRDRVRTFMDGIPLQAGVIASGVVLILAQRVLPASQVAVIGATAAALATVAMWLARRSYPAAVVQTLRVGDPEVFGGGPEAFGGSLRDAEALAVLVEKSADRDPAIRRISMELLAEAEAPAAVEAVRRGLEDDDARVRAAAARAASRVDGPGLVPGLRRLLGDDDASVRAAAVRRLPRGGDTDREVRRLLDDSDPVVRAGAARALIRDGATDPDARDVLDGMLADPRPEWREAVLDGFRGTEVGSRAGLEAVRDSHPAVRTAAVATLREHPVHGSLDALVELLADPSGSVREAAVSALAAAGTEARAHLEGVLQDRRYEAGALAVLADIEGADAEVVRLAAERHTGEATRFGRLLRDLGKDDDERLDLLRGALRYHAFRHAMTALRAVSGTGDPGSMRVAIDGLTSWDPVQRGNALEALEAMGDAGLVRPLVRLWDLEPEGRGRRRPEVLVDLMDDHDPWVRACAALSAARSPDGPLRPALARLAASDPDTLVRDTALASLEGGIGLEGVAAVSMMERVLFLRKVPLFADLDPPDLRAVAQAVTEHAFADGEVVATEGEPGDELFIVVEGEIRVVVGGLDRSGREVARRGSGEYVGEMAVISREPRMASLVCSGPVRVLALDRARFERILRERPEAGLAVMRVLANRLRESYAPSR